MIETINFTLNGKPTSLTLEGERMLLWVLRTDLELTGTKCGCAKGFCGACTVIVGNEAVRSCQLPLKQLEGQEVVTIEGLSGEGRLHPLQEAFIEHDALQCGFCTPGMILSAYSLLLKNSSPSRQEIIESLDDNLCRCGAHTQIIRAVETAAQKAEE